LIFYIWGSRDFLNMGSRDFLNIGYTRGRAGKIRGPVRDSKLGPIILQNLHYSISIMYIF
jgi:hypothetical protein